MKQPPLLYVPDISTGRLPDEEAHHALRVLRLKADDEVVLFDGKGLFYRARLTLADHGSCHFRIEQTEPWHKPWTGHIHLAIAPTKNMDRMEWMVEKATEIGFDELTLLLCDNSERKVVRTDRLEKIVIAAMKQSIKATKPIINNLTPFRIFVESHPKGGFICHCWPEGAKTDLTAHNFPSTSPQQVVMVGPEGDFSQEEVAFALRHGWEAASLGPCRLRTETAGLMGIIAMQWMNKQRHIEP